MRTPPDWRSQAIALSGVLEAAMLVDQIARTGAAPADEMEALSGSLFKFEWDTIEAIFGGIGALARGLAMLEDLCRQGSAGATRPVMGYAMSMLYLADKLRRDKDTMDIIRSRLNHTAFKSTHFEVEFDSLAASVSSIYQDTLSRYRYRIQVSGSAEHLRDNRNADRVRTLLLAGVRAAILWRHVGGSRLQFMLNRKHLARACNTLLDAR